MIFIQTEYSFKEVFYPLNEAVKDAAEQGHKEVCIIDTTTFGYVKFEKACREHGVKPIYGLSIMLTDKSVKHRSVYQTYDKAERIILIAKDSSGVCEIYRLFSKSKERYNRFNRLLPSDLEFSDLIIISKNFGIEGSIWNLCTHTAKYSKPEHKPVYQCITGDRGVPPTPGHFMCDDDHVKHCSPAAMASRDNIASMTYDFNLPRASMIKYNGNRNFEEDCWAGLERVVPYYSSEYLKRMKYEIDMIKMKGFQDYFMIVADMIRDAKKTMIVGPGRGSSGGSLVCYALGITTMDPIKHGLIFERFIDVNRNDLPDIDTDYPDTRRGDVIEATRRKYSSVYKMSTVSFYSPRTILNDFSKEYGVPMYDLNELKGAIIERSSGDARAKDCLGDTLAGEVGKKFLEKYPYMSICDMAEGHARHHGTHASGIIVLDEDINKFGAVDAEAGILYLDKRDADYLGLLKVDCLGLRTLSVIENCLSLSGVDLDHIYTIPLDLPDVLEVFNGDDLSDIFQFDGSAVGMVCSRLTVRCFADLAAITSLGRPGALNSGGADTYIKINEGDQERESLGEDYDRITDDTNGVVIYQEQTMVLLREIGSLSWEEVNILRRAMSKTLGDEFFSSYKEKFVCGAINNGYSEDDAAKIWTAIASMGSYAFNKSHAVAYAMISYWCAYCKAKYPLNFLAANLNNAKSDDHALKLLRRYTKSHNIEYKPVDPDLSMVGWTIQDGVLIGGLTNIKGVGEKKALDIIARRDGTSKRKLTSTMYKILMDPKTPFDELYPIESKYSHIYRDFNVIRICDIPTSHEVTIIGKLLIKDLRDRNDVQSVIKRGGKRVDTNTHYLNLTIEDDTGLIKGTIAPFDMDMLDGLRLAEALIVGEVIAIKGTVREGWNTISIKGVMKVGDI